MFIQSITDTNLASYALGIKLRDMAIEANSGGRYEPKPIQTSTTKEMIQEYQDEQNKPIKIKGKYYRYHPSTVIIDQIPIDYTKLEPALTDQEIEDMRNNLKEGARYLTENQKLLKQKK